MDCHTEHRFFNLFPSVPSCKREESDYECTGCLFNHPTNHLIKSNRSTFMTIKYGAEELAEYKLTRSEIAKVLGKSSNAVRMSMRQGNKMGLEYREGPNGYLFKFPKTYETNTVNTMSANQGGHGQSSVFPGPTHKDTPGETLGVIHKAYTGRSNQYTQSKTKSVNRGATHRGEGKYQNEAFKMANESKIMASMNKKFKSPEHKKVFMDMTDSAFELAYKNSLKKEDQKFKKEAPQMFNNGNRTAVPTKYGSMLNARGLQNLDNKEHRRLARKDEEENGIKLQEKYMDKVQMDGSVKRELTKINVPDFQVRSHDTSFFVGHAKYDDFTTDYDVDRKEVAVEFSQYELDRYSKPTERTEFKNKIDEDIYRAKKYLLKTKGTY